MSPVGKKTEARIEARVLGSALAGCSELILFHPVDTIAKRLMSHHGQVRQATLSDTAIMLNQVVFKEANEFAWNRKFMSLFPGLGYGAGYKILQRVYKFGGQPFVKDYMKRNYTDSFNATFGKKNALPLMHATAGSLIGVGEVALLPLDLLKIKAQTNPEALAGRGIVDIFRKEGWNLYRGGGWTAARNAPGSFALFGGAALVKEKVFKLEDYSAATWTQDFVASIAGAMASITVAAPLDVVKTRIQNKPFDSHTPGIVIVRDLVAKEGMGAFFKGLTPKLLVVGPKLIFSFTVAQHLMSYFEHVLGV